MRFFARRRAARKAALFPYHQCEVCGAHLAPDERVEITDSTGLTRIEGFVGGGDTTATYCRKHSPKEIAA